MDRMEARRTRRTRRPRRGAVVLLGIGAFGLAAASAASLGGLTTGSLGADNAAVASCDTNGVTLAYGTPAYDAATGVYKISTATVGGIAAGCIGKTVYVTLADSTGASLGGGSGVLASGTSITVTLATNASAKAIVNAAVAIS
jgi:hypothetical protein